MKRVYGSTALEASGVVDTDRVVVEEIHVTNDGSAAWYFQIFEESAVPADTAVPFDIVRVPAGSTASIRWDGRRSEGLDVDALSFAVSTTAATKTLGPAEAFVAVYGSPR